MHGFFLGAPASQQFRLTNNRLNRQLPGPPPEKGASDEVVASPDDELLRVLEEDGKWVHQSVRVPPAAHGTRATR